MLQTSGPVFPIAEQKAFPNASSPQAAQFEGSPEHVAFAVLGSAIDVMGNIEFTGTPPERRRRRRGNGG